MVASGRCGKGFVSAETCRGWEGVKFNKRKQKTDNYKMLLVSLCAVLVMLNTALNEIR